MKKYLFYVLIIFLCSNLYSNEMILLNRNIQNNSASMKINSIDHSQSVFDLESFGKSKKNGSSYILIGALLIGTLGLPVTIGGIIFLSTYITDPNTYFNINRLSIENTGILSLAVFLFTVAGISIIIGSILLIVGCIIFSKYRKRKVSFFIDNVNTHNISFGLKYSF